MARFLLRRLLLALPTLLGICVITFALIHLAPGDPVDAATRGESRGAARGRDAVRRLYFLDLPLFYNSSPRGLESRTARLLSALSAAPASAEASPLAELRRCGTLCLPDLAASLAASGQSERARLERAVAAIRFDHPRLGSGAASTTAWLGGALPLLEGEALASVARQLGGSPDAVPLLLDRGTAALPAAMAVLLDGPAASRAAASQVVSALTGIEGRLGEGSEADARILASWSEWWYQHRRDHVRFPLWGRLAGRVTETQFGKWLGRVLSLRFGSSIADGRPVAEKLGQALPVTLLLSLISMALAYAIAIPLGVSAAVRRGSVLDRAIGISVFLLYSLPPFWVAMMLILLLGGVGYLDWFPIDGLCSPGLEQATGWTWLVDRVHHLVLPVVCLTYGSLAVLSRYQRSAMLEVIRQDYVRTARAKGLAERTVVLKHALRNALLPTITLLGLQLPYLISGSVIIEKIFNIPGMGLLTFQAFLHRDYPVIMAVAVLSAALTLFGLMLSDLCYALADPRIRLEGRS